MLYFNTNVGATLDPKPSRRDIWRRERPTHPLFDMSGNGLGDSSGLHKRWKCTPKYLPCRYAALETNVDINQESLLS